MCTPILGDQTQLKALVQGEPGVAYGQPFGEGAAQLTLR